MLGLLEGGRRWTGIVKEQTFFFFNQDKISGRYRKSHHQSVGIADGCPFSLIWKGHREGEGS